MTTNVDFTKTAFVSLIDTLGQSDYRKTDRGAFHSFDKEYEIFQNKRILTDFCWIFLETKGFSSKGVRDFWE